MIRYNNFTKSLLGIYNDKFNKMTILIYIGKFLYDFVRKRCEINAPHIKTAFTPINVVHLIYNLGKG